MLKQSTVDKLKKRAEDSSATTATATAFVKQLQEAAKRVEKEAALLEDPQEGQDNNISNSSDEESLNKDIWGSTQWPFKL